MTTSDRNIATHETLLPAAWYTDKDIFLAEQRDIFASSWQYVGRVDQLKNSGDYFTSKLNNVPIIVVRNTRHELCAYVNVCRHRGAEIILTGKSGHSDLLRCHYHSWCWDLDGQLHTAPGTRSDKSFCKDQFPLTRLELESLGPFLFAAYKPKLSWTTLSSKLSSVLNETGVPLANLQYLATKSYRMKCNWKVVVENFLECYHCPGSHPSFCKVIDIKNYQVFPYKYCSVQKGRNKITDQPTESSGFPDTGYYSFLWPNFMVNTYPGRYNASTNFIIPVSESETMAVYEFYVDPDMGDAEARKVVDLIDEVQSEDVVICESVQRGLESGFYEKGYLADAEKGVAHFQGLVREHLDISKSLASLRHS